jgi:holo-[acyl-carrier protein] synthase
LRVPASSIRVGCDLVELRRFERILSRNPPDFRAELFTAAEQQRSRSVAELARGFAVKEATLKALGTGMVSGIRATDVEVTLEGDECRIELHGVPAALARSLGATLSARAWIEAGHAAAVVELQLAGRTRP